MRKQRFGIGAMAVAMVVGLMGSTARSAEPAMSTDAALALQFCDMAQSVLRDEAITDSHWHKAVALLQAARRLDPAEPRYPRLQADALLALRNSPEALEAVNAFRKLSPDDRVSQVEAIELFAAQMQTADQKLVYFRDLLARQAVPAEVRAVIAVQTAGVLLNKGQDAEAGAMIDEALKLDVLNMAALSAKLARVGPSATPEQRLSLMLAVLRSNPAQPAVLAAVGRELVGAGLPGDALRWYEQASRVAVASRTYLSHGTVLEYAGALLLADKADAAVDILDRMIAADPADHVSVALRMLIELQRGEAAAAEKHRIQAHNALVNQLSTVLASIGVKGAATRPVDQGELSLPELVGDIEAFKKTATEQQKASYAEALAELAWFEVYFNKRPADAEKLLKPYVALAEGNPGATTLATRLAGWIYLVQPGHMEEARVKLSAVADRDPMSALGLIKTYGEAEQAKARQEAQKLLSADAVAGANIVERAVIADALRDTGARPGPGSRAAAILGVIEKFPMGWLAILDNPAGFYSLRAEPLKITHSFGEPMLVKVTLQNTSTYDLTIGPDGAIQPGIWFDVELGRPLNLGNASVKSLPGVCVERLTERLVLRPRESVAKIVHIDQGMLSLILSQKAPLAAVSFTGSVRTNPQTAGGGQIGCGPAGYTAFFTRPMERAGSPATLEAPKSLAAAISSGTGAARVRNLNLLGIYSVAFLSQEDANAKQQGAMWRDTIGRWRVDADASVRAVAGWISCWMAPEIDPAVSAMLKDGEPWQERLLGLAGMVQLLDRLPAGRPKELARERVQNDSDPVVKEFARATLDLLNNPAATQPAASTQPAR